MEDILRDVFGIFVQVVRLTVIWILFSDTHAAAYTGGVGKTGEVVVVGSVSVSKHAGGFPSTRPWARPQCAPHAAWSLIYREITVKALDYSGSLRGYLICGEEH